MHEHYKIIGVEGSNQQRNMMSGFAKEEAQLVDLWLPHVLPVAGAGEAETAQIGQTFVLTGWRGAGWHMVFLNK